eukprot:CAMPEP_0171283886 /NCGR_PEP_ID=MMETSP0790-20130122/67660_1 /TAXON_ID=2925 /ORGANISM="Alexandrium catenella, Strain OF101" /LENGTH=152 /DNA_ID=CAMNT_0011753177 /DNA_START=25 /DNA_END=480 /DNA_ORIENTATION=-
MMRCHANDVEAAFGCLADMRRNGLSPDIDTIFGLLSSCRRCNDMGRARYAVEVMQSLKLQQTAELKSCYEGSSSMAVRRLEPPAGLPFRRGSCLAGGVLLSTLPLAGRTTGRAPIHTVRYHGSVRPSEHLELRILPQQRVNRAKQREAMKAG